MVEHASARLLDDASEPMSLILEIKAIVR